jgi:tRNA (adenine22-N1)-methyltransferase
MELPSRLAAIAELVLADRPMADIGTDHGHLPAALIAAGRVPYAIGVDLRRGPLAQAGRAAARVGGALELRLGEGLQPLNPGEVATIVVAGMGGPLIGEILRRGRQQLRGVSRLVLQPNQAAERVRDAIEVLAWHLVHERWVEDRGRLYPVLVAEPGARAPLAEIDRIQGPMLRQGGGALHQGWLASERERYAAAILSAQQGGAHQALPDLQRRSAWLC